MKLPTPSARWITLRQWRRQPTNFLISVGTRGGRRQARNGLQGAVGGGGADLQVTCWWIGGLPDECNKYNNPSV